jgi:hypothetical protein
MANLTKPVGLSDLKITGTDPTNFPDGKGSFAPFLAASGQIQIDDEVISYVAHYHGEFQGLTRGANSTTPATHLIGAAINPLAVQE